MSFWESVKKKIKKAKKSNKSKPREIWQGKSFILEDIITPSTLVGGVGEDSADPFVSSLYNFPELETASNHINLYSEPSRNAFELLDPRVSLPNLLENKVTSSIAAEPSHQIEQLLDNLRVANPQPLSYEASSGNANSFSVNPSMLLASDGCPPEPPSKGIDTNPGTPVVKPPDIPKLININPGVPGITLPDVDPPIYVLPFDPPITDKPPKLNFIREHQPLVGIIDTGFNAKNPDIDYSRVKSGHDYVDNDNDSLISNGKGNEHGTHVLGIIGATQDNGIGIDGINDKAPIWVGRAIGSGKWAESLKEFVDEFKISGQPNGVVNLSFDLTQTNPDGSVTTRYELTPQEREALEYARQNGVIVVVAAGNDGGTMSALGQASQEFDNIITVGSVDFNKQKTGYSNFGYGLDLMAYGGTKEQPIISTIGDGADIGEEEPPEDEMSANAINAFEEVFSSFSDSNLKDIEIDEQELEKLTLEERQVYEQATKDIDKVLQDYLDAAGQKIALEYVDGYYVASVDVLDKFINDFDGDLGDTMLKAQEILNDAGTSTDTAAKTSETNADFSIPLDLGIGEMAGTSVAAAKVTGTVSQVWAANPKLSYQQVKEILKQTAIDLNTTGWDKETGSGLVDIAAAIELAKKTQPQAYQPKPLVSPFTWGGEGKVTPGERAVAVSVPTFTGSIMNAGYVTRTGWLRIRSGPGTQYAEVGRKYPGDAVNFDAYENNGQWVPDPFMPGGGSSRWYKIAGTNNWMSALYIDNTPERAEEERRRQEQIRQAEEAARRAEEEARRAEEAARQAEEELRKLEEEARRQAEEEARRYAEEQLQKILEEAKRRQEQLQTVLGEVTQKVGDLGDLTGSYISNGVTIYKYTKGNLLIKPNGSSAFYEVGKKVVEFFDPNQEGSFGNYVRNDYWDPNHPLLVNVANVASKGIDHADAIEQMGKFITYTGYQTGSNGFVLYPPRFGNYSKHVDNTLGFLAQQTRNWDEFIEGKTYTNPGKNGFVFKTKGALPKGTKWLGKAGTIGKILGFVPAAWEYSQAKTDQERDKIIISEGAELLGGMIGGAIGGMLFAPVFPPAGAIVGGIAGSIVGGYFGKKGGELVADKWGKNIRETTGNAWNAATSSVNAVLEAAKQKAAEAKQKAQELVKQARAAYETAKVNVQQAKAAYQNFKVEVQKATTQIVQQSQHKIKEAAQKVMNFVTQHPIVKAGSKVINHVANYAKKAVKTVGNIINVTKQFVNNVIETGKQIVNNVIEQGKQAYENVKNFVSEKVEQGKQFVTDTYKKAAESFNTVTNTISNGFNGVKSLFGWG